MYHNKLTCQGEKAKNSNSPIVAFIYNKVKVSAAYALIKTF